MAVGTTRLRILGMFVVEGLGLGAIGGALGLALGYVLAIGLTRAGILMPPPPTFTTGCGLPAEAGRAGTARKHLRRPRRGHARRPSSRRAAGE